MSEKKGKFIFQGVKEGDGDDFKKIIFNPPLVINYEIDEKMAHVVFDFGMDMFCPLDAENNWLINGYEGLTSESSNEEILMKTVLFDLFHALFQPSDNENYSHFHWALKGWLNDRATTSA